VRWLTRVLAGLLGYAARLLPPGRQQWAEAVEAEAGEVAAGWPRLRWLAGGLRLVGREATVARKIVYWLGAGAVAAAGAWVVWLTWHSYGANDPMAVTDRIRVLAGVAALITLPWVGRRRGWFGPVGSTRTARLARVTGCAALCGLGVSLVRMDSRLFAAPHGPAPFSLPREIVALVVVGAGLATLAVIKARWPDADPAALGSVAAIAGVLLFVTVPVQALTVSYAAGILAATSRRPAVANASLGAGALAGLAAGLITVLAVLGLTRVDDRYADWLFLIVITTIFLLGTLAGAAAVWRLPGTGDPETLRAARARQALLAGAVTGAVCGMMLTGLSMTAAFVMIIGPVLGAMGGALGGLLAADHPLRPRLARNWAAGLFARN
jgi:hypothetical protein